MSLYDSSKNLIAGTGNIAPIEAVIPSDASASNKLVTESDVEYFYQASDVEGEYDANDFAIVGKITRYCVKSPVHGYQVNGTAWWGFYETVCFRGGGYGYQTFRTMLGTSVMAIRQLYNGSWGDWQKLVTESDLPKTKIYSYTDAVTSGVEIILDPSSSHDWWNLLASGNILSISLVTCDTTNATDVGAWVGTSTANHSLILRPAATASNSYYRVLVTYTGVSL